MNQSHDWLRIWISSLFKFVMIIILQLNAFFKERLEMWRIQKWGILASAGSGIGMAWVKRRNAPMLWDAAACVNSEITSRDL